MLSSRNDIILTIYQNIRTVFRLTDIALLVGDTDFQSLNKKLNYYVRTGKLANPRKGIYTKPNYNYEELACAIYTPSYISLEYTLQKAGLIFQYDSRVTAVSYLSRTVDVEGRVVQFRKVKSELLINTEGVIRQDNHVNIASTERAFLDLLYLDPDFYFDNPSLLNKDLVNRLLPFYQSKTMFRRVNKLLRNV
jgi:hypothetical protein